MVKATGIEPATFWNLQRTGIRRATIAPRLRSCRMSPIFENGVASMRITRSQDDTYTSQSMSLILINSKYTPDDQRSSYSIRSCIVDSFRRSFVCFSTRRYGFELRICDVGVRVCCLYFNHFDRREYKSPSLHQIPFIANGTRCRQFRSDLAAFSPRPYERFYDDL